MTYSILNSDHLSSLFEECITDLKDRNTGKMMILANLMVTLSHATKKKVFFTLPQAIGGYAQEINMFKQIIAIPILEPEDRDKNKEFLTNCINEGVESLEILKDELCNGSECDCRKIVSAVANLSKSGSELNLQRMLLGGIHPPSGGHFEEE